MKIGVVGYGSIGQRHATNFRKLGHKVLVYDPMIAFKDVKFERNIYEDCDAVVVATPTMFHEGPLRACIERGRHVLVEKPISATEGALPELLRIADEKKLVVMMGNNLHFHACVKQARAWLQQGKTGRPLWANFICAQKAEFKYLTDSVVLNWGAHEVNLALYLFGPVQSVLSAAINKDEGIADFVLNHTSGMRSSFHLDYITPNEIRESWIVGEDANIGIDLVGRTISLGEVVERMPGSFDEDYIDEAKAFIDKIEGRPASGADGWQGLVTLKVLLDVRKKAGLV